MLKRFRLPYVYLISSCFAIGLLSACSSSVDVSLKAQNENNHKRVQTTNTTQALAPSESILHNDFSSLEKAQALASNQGFVYQGQFTPYQGSSARIYGSTSAGCIEGTQELNDAFEDFQIQRWAPNRNYAHPLMMQYLADLRHRTKDLGLPPLLIGDLSRYLGGSYGPRSNHASHNTGIDVDLPFDFALPRKTESELNSPKDVYIVKGSKVQPSFTKSIELYIKSAASDPRVDRIFVAPMIKKRMCNVYQDEANNGFLQKLRPWFGHQAHMHVRLKCPFDSPDCISQAPIPQGNGCGYELESWFLPPPPNTNKAKAKKKERVLPQKCAILLKDYQ